MIIYVDGACSGNGAATAVGGFGVIVLDDNEKFITEHHPSVATGEEPTATVTTDGAMNISQTGAKLSG